MGFLDKLRRVPTAYWIAGAGGGALLVDLVVEKDRSVLSALWRGMTHGAQAASSAPAPAPAPSAPAGPSMPPQSMAMPPMPPPQMMAPPQMMMQPPMYLPEAYGLMPGWSRGWRPQQRVYYPAFQPRYGGEQAHRRGWGSHLAPPPWV